MKRPILAAFGLLVVAGVLLYLIWLVPKVSGEKTQGAATPAASPTRSNEQGQPGMEGSAGEPRQPGTEIPGAPPDVTPGAVPIGDPYSDQEMERLKRGAETNSEVPCQGGQDGAETLGSPGETSTCPTPTP
jgi:hypothetical protein